MNIEDQIADTRKRILSDTRGQIGFDDAQRMAQYQVLRARLDAVKTVDDLREIMMYQLKASIP